MTCFLDLRLKVRGRPMLTELSGPQDHTGRTSRICIPKGEDTGIRKLLGGRLCPFASIIRLQRGKWREQNCTFFNTLLIINQVRGHWNLFS